MAQLSHQLMRHVWSGGEAHFVHGAHWVDFTHFKTNCGTRDSNPSFWSGYGAPTTRPKPLLGNSAAPYIFEVWAAIKTFARPE
ncbi:hypothetical protein VNO77_42345 [Canavalia gladiata]|uniref:Uncharacterized protein n=1 Tax=Canavalia gladiata TaxID=3824 RepID=A0AAN9PSN1_CANGL